MPFLFFPLVHSTKPVDQRITNAPSFQVIDERWIVKGKTGNASLPVRLGTRIYPKRVKEIFLGLGPIVVVVRINSSQKPSLVGWIGGDLPTESRGRVEDARGVSGSVMKHSWAIMS